MVYFTAHDFVFRFRWLTLQSWWCWSVSQQLHWQREIPQCTDVPCSPSCNHLLQSGTFSSVSPYHLDRQLQFSAVTKQNCIMYDRCFQLTNMHALFLWCLSQGAYIEVDLVDLVDYLQVSGQEGLQQIYRPALQSFRENCVVGVGKRAPGEVPGLQCRGNTSHPSYAISSLWTL